MVQDDTAGARGNMRPCGCHRGRPCTCDMGKQLTIGEYACGECINCQLNVKALNKRRKAVRKCVKYDEYMAEQSFDRLEIAPGCVFRMLKPDWDIQTKTPFYTEMRQLRLGLLALRVQSAKTIERQLFLRRKYNRDLVRAHEASQRAMELRSCPGSKQTRRLTAEVTHIDSDVFDAHSKQLIPADTVLPELQARVDTASEIIAVAERDLQLIEDYVYRIAVIKLQATARAYMRAQRWKWIWAAFRDDVQFAAAVVIQSAFRMSRCKAILPFLRSLQGEDHKRLAAERLRRFFVRLGIVKKLKAEQERAEAMARAHAAKNHGADRLFRVAERIICRLAFWNWRERQRQATVHGERRVLTAILCIQRHWRGLRARLSYRRMRHRHRLSAPVRSLYDKFVCHGDLWRLLSDFDAMIRRYERREEEEREDATTFLAKMVREKQLQEDQMMQSWLAASALESPIVKGAQSVVSAFELDISPAEAFPLGNAVLHSSIAKDLVALSVNQLKSDVFPSDLPATVVRQAIYDGFSIKDTVAVMRGLQAQGRDSTDVQLVLKVLKSRAPLMRNSWQPERVVRQKARTRVEIETGTVSIQATTLSPGKRKLRRSKPPSQSSQDMNFLSENMLDNIPGGLNGAIDRLLFVAGMRCFDPDAPRVLSEGKSSKGAFVFRLDASKDPWRSYLNMASPLMKIRREQLVLAAIKPSIQVIREKKCSTAFDILHVARGVDEMVAWGIPRPLAVSVYDVIELLHQQSVNRSDRSIQRQLRVSAQFEAFADRRETEKRIDWKHDRRKRVDPKEIQQVELAINRDVLELPIVDASAPVDSVIFKACFLLCAVEEADASMPSTEEQPSHSRDFSTLAIENYHEFLASLVIAQREGREDDVRDLVKRRSTVAAHLADRFSSKLKALKLYTAADLKKRHTKASRYLPERVAAQIIELLSDLPDRAAVVGQIQPDHPQFAMLPAPVSPLIRQSKTTVDWLDEDLRSITIPF